MKKLSIITILILCLAGLLFAGKWPEGVKELKIKSNTTFTIAGNLKNGKIIEDLSWASSSSVACFPATQNESFRGKHVFYGTYIPPQSIMKIKVIPSEELNISLYAYMISTTDFERFPPNLHTCLSCEASYNNGKPNPGQEESIRLNAIKHPYNVVIAVAGPKGVEQGKYKLQVELITRAPEPVISGELPVTDIKSEQNKEVEIKGDIKNGQLIPVSWANSGQVACFPATQNENFKGNHVFFRTQLPAYSILDITLVPAKPDVDVNLYAYRLSSTDFKTMPPKVYTGACESSFSYQGRNPGEEEKVQFYSARNPYNIIIGVAGPENITSGEFTLKAKLTSRK